MECGNLKIDIGCGKERVEGYIGVDIKDFGQKVIRDLRRGLPFCDNSAINIQCKHVLEHFDNEDAMFVLNECWRVLKSEGELFLEVPHKDNFRAYILPHKIRFNEETIRDLTLNDREEIYDMKPWTIKELIVKQGKAEKANSKIYCWLKPKNKE